jgi:hypothetical protein
MLNEKALHAEGLAKTGAGLFKKAEKYAVNSE